MPTTLESLTLAYLEADATLVGILTGGIFDASELDRLGLSILQVAVEVDGIRLRPCMFLRWADEIPVAAPRRIGASSRFLDAYFYQDAGYDQIEIAMKRVRTLLDMRDIGTTDYDSLAYFEWLGNLGNFEDEEMGRARANRSRYSVTLVAK